jgi:hypothetical protein
VEVGSHTRHFWSSIFGLLFHIRGYSRHPRLNLSFVLVAAQGRAGHFVVILNRPVWTTRILAISATARITRHTRVIPVPPGHRSQSIMHPRLFTIGHSTHPIGPFLELLTRHEIEILADVRSSPGSRCGQICSNDILATCFRRTACYHHKYGMQKTRSKKDTEQISGFLEMCINDASLFVVVVGRLTNRQSGWSR